MKIKKISLIVLLIAVGFVSSWAQSTVSGVILDAADNDVIEEANLLLLGLGVDLRTTSDEDGNFSFPAVKSGSYRIYAVADEYREYLDTIQVGTENVDLMIKMVEFGFDLETVEVKVKKGERGLRKLRDVELTTINAGKKTEVILLANINANLASNNARQIYSQVSGLNIYENGDGGLQLNVGGRGMDPNRSANFNTRQNGYDISADVLGYPESYYSPPAEALAEIQVIRGAASLQYGTQFGGLINFKFRAPVEDKKVEVTTRQAIASNALFTSFNSISGTVKKFSYYTYFNYKRGDGFRPNSEFEAFNAYADLRYAFSENTKLSLELTFLDYLAKQPGGLTDFLFYTDRDFSNRERNWFDVNWNLACLKFSHKFSAKTDFTANVFGLNAHRKALGIRNHKVSVVDELSDPRDLIVGKFRNWGTEMRYLTRYNLGKTYNVFLIGAKYYQSKNTADQGPGTNGLGPDFFIDDSFTDVYPDQSSFVYPNLNLTLFGENIFNLTDKFSITPGWRFEYIRTESEGDYRRLLFDRTGEVLVDNLLTDNRVFDRRFLLLGVGLSYKESENFEVVGNISQNYRSVTFSDIRITNPSYQIDPDISDESGFTADLGLRSKVGQYLNVDFGVYGLLYADRLGEVLKPEVNALGVETSKIVRFRGNLGDAMMFGFESLVDWNLRNTFFAHKQEIRLSAFTNVAFTQSEYIRSDIPGVVGNEVEFIPDWNIKTGLKFGYKNFNGSFQHTFLTRQFTDASNALQDPEDDQSGIRGTIPAYQIMDLSLSYKWNKFRFETGSNNIGNAWYFTRRATGYPGPGIIPSVPRTFYLAVQLKI